jgi:DNA-binding GntR family transcriptional regulator
VREIYEVRIALFALVSRLGVERATDGDLKRLRALQQELERAAEADDVDT